MSQVGRDVVPCPDGHKDGRVRRRGVVPRSDGPRQRYECIRPGGASHLFNTPLETPQREAPAARRQQCPEPHHMGSRVQSRGTRTTATGTWARYTCTPVRGERHNFQLMVDPSGNALMALHPAPLCSQHPGGRVTRDGSFGPAGRRRQRYECVSPDGARHWFSPPLSREVVLGNQVCTTCDELLSPHHGTLTGSRHTPWTLPTLVRALDDLSQGSSYADVARTMKAYRDRADQHLQEVHGLPALRAAKTEKSRAAVEGRNGWRSAAHLVEQYSPLLFTRVSEQMRRREERQRTINDAVLEAGGVLQHPLTYVLDSVVVELPRRHSKRTQAQLAQWYVLVVTEVRWRDTPNGPQRDPRLRLARTLPANTEQAWRLVLDELPVAPDVVVSDAGTGMLNAVASKYADRPPALIPSLHHVHTNIRTLLRELTSTKPGRGRKRSPIPEDIAKRLDILRRDELLAASDQQWTAWWDDLLEAVAALDVPMAGLVQQRKLYEPALAAALPVLRAMPQLPASNAAVEVLSRHKLDPFLAGRKHVFRNAARTNFLFDLAVCRDQGAFVDLDTLGKLIRTDNEQADGWAPAPRMLDDLQPPRPVKVPGQVAAPLPPLYSSLLNPHLVPALSERRSGS